MYQEMQLFKFILCFVFISLLFFTLSLEAREPLPPRFSAAAYTGVYTVGQADLMVSLDGDRQHNLYVDPQGAYGSDQQWYGDVGLGYRWIKNDAAILGWYLFAGHTRVENNSNFWIVSPGIEALGSRWDARINAYLPVAGRSNEIGIENFNVENTPVFTGHTEIINSVFNDANAIQQIGNGADARVGYQLFRTVPLKGYLGAYFFSITNTENVRGGAAGLEYWFDDNIRIFANYSYDNYQHSNVIGGLGISFGGVRKHWADPSLSERLTDPVERYLANLGHGSGIPSKTLLYGIGSGSSTQLISTDIAFFSQTGTPNAGGAGLTLASCTFENPCGPTDFSQAGVDTLNTLLPNTMMYFNGGSYGGGTVSLNAGQSVRSRTADYKQLANGSARSSFNNDIDLVGNNTLENVILLPGATIGSLANGSNNLITGSQIGAMNAPASIGVRQNSGSLTINNTTIFAADQAVFADGFFTPVTISILNSQLNVTNNIAVNAEGISANKATITVNNTQIQMNGSATLSGILVGDSMLNVNNTNITVDSTSNAFALTNINANNSIVVNGGELNATSTLNPMILAGGNTGVNISASTICRINGSIVACP